MVDQFHLPDLDTAVHHIPALFYKVKQCLSMSQCLAETDDRHMSTACRVSFIVGQNAVINRLPQPLAQLGKGDIIIAPDEHSCVADGEPPELNRKRPHPRQRRFRNLNARLQLLLHIMEV